MTITTPGLARLDEQECRRLLADHPIHVGRLAFTLERRPMVLPVNYRFDQGEVVLRLVTGSALSAAIGREVAFEVDAVDERWEEGWSVVVQGRAEVVKDEARLARLRTLPLRPWVESPAERYVTIAPERITGRRIV